MNKMVTRATLKEEDGWRGHNFISLRREEISYTTRILIKGRKLFEIGEVVKEIPIGDSSCAMYSDHNAVHITPKRGRYYELWIGDPLHVKKAKYQCSFKLRPDDPDDARRYTVWRISNHTTIYVVAWQVVARELPEEQQLSELDELKRVVNQL